MGPGEDEESSTWSGKALVRLADLVGSGGADMVWYGLVRFVTFC
jgi:hypothetical protein